MNILESRFDGCFSCGIRIRHDDCNGGASCHIEADTIKDCPTGILYAGNNNPQPGPMKFPSIVNCIIGNYSISSLGYGIDAQSSFTNSQVPITPLIENDSITGFYGGVRLSLVDKGCELKANRIKSNNMYGLYLKGSSPHLHASAQNVPNVFRFNGVGIYRDEGSAPIVNNTVIRDHISKGAIIQNRAPGASMPNFFGGFGNSNTFTHAYPSSNYRHIKNYCPSFLNAANNYWGSNPPPLWSFDGPVNWAPCLEGDPYPTYGKRETEFSPVGDRLALSQNYPNPFNPTTRLYFYLESPGYATLKVYGITGQLINALVSGNFSGGEHQIIWDGKDTQGVDVASGIYFYVLSTTQGRISRTMTLLR